MAAAADIWRFAQPDDPAAAPDKWSLYSLTYHHNAQWRGDPRYLFPAQVNATQGGLAVSSGYTSLIAAGPKAGVVVYGMYFNRSNAVDPYPQVTFAMPFAFA